MDCTSSYCFLVSHRGFFSPTDVRNGVVGVGSDTSWEAHNMSAYLSVSVDKAIGECGTFS